MAQSKGMDYQGWPSRKPVWRIGAFFLGMAVAVGVFCWQQNNEWTFLQRYYLAMHVKTWIRFELLPKSGAKYALIDAVNGNAKERMAIGNEVEMSTRPASSELCYRTQLIPVSGKKLVAWPADDAKFRALVENSNEVICIGAPDGTIFYTTPSVERVLGYKADSWFGRNAFEIMHPDYAELAGAAVRQLAGKPTGTVLSLVAQVRHRDGSWKWVEAVLTNLIGQPAVGGIVCNYRDVTASHLAEDAVRSSEQRYRLLAESLPQMVSIHDEEGRYIYCNSHLRNYHGLTGSGALPRDWKEGVPPEDIEALLTCPWKNGVPKPWESECRIRRASDGALRWHSVRIIPLCGLLY